VKFATDAKIFRGPFLRILWLDCGVL